jgi:hypothetical protein
VLDSSAVAVNPFQREERPRGLRRWLPGLQMVRTYQRGWLLKDVLAGLVLTAILVPVGMGYAEAAGLPAIYGLYATIVPLIAYAIFGSSRILVLGPDSSRAADALSDLDDELQPAGLELCFAEMDEPL